MLATLRTLEIDLAPVLGRLGLGFEDLHQLPERLTPCVFMMRATSWTVSGKSWRT
jgi:hypothetical protein